MVKAATVSLLQSMRSADPERRDRYVTSPRRVLTQPSEAVANKCAQPARCYATPRDAHQTPGIHEIGGGVRWWCEGGWGGRPRQLRSRARRSGRDNEQGDLVVAVSDVIQSPSGEKYEALGFLGRGTFGQVLKVRADGNKCLALKVM